MVTKTAKPADAAKTTFNDLPAGSFALPFTVRVEKQIRDGELTDVNVYEYADEWDNALAQLFSLAGHPVKLRHDRELWGIDAALHKLEDCAAKPGLIQIREAARKAMSSGNGQNAVLLLTHLHYQLWIIERENAVIPPARVGKKFIDGRRQANKLGPVARRVTAHLKEDAAASAVTVWDAIEERPPKGFTFCHNSLGRYIEDERGRTVMEWKRFNNLISERRKALK